MICPVRVDHAVHACLGGEKFPNTKAVIKRIETKKHVPLYWWQRWDFYAIILSITTNNALLFNCFTISFCLQLRRSGQTLKYWG
jgi:hypothetical protein